MSYTETITEQDVIRLARDIEAIYQDIKNAAQNWRECKRSGSKTIDEILGLLSTMNGREVLTGDVMPPNVRDTVKEARRYAAAVMREIDESPAEFCATLRVPKVHISKGNAKMGTIPSFSTLPGVWATTKAGKKVCGIAGTCAGVCDNCEKDCYAVRILRMQRPDTVAAWADNTRMARSKKGRAAIVREVTNYCHKRKCKAFRIHVSGEFENENELFMWFAIAQACPDTTFYAYTKRGNLMQYERPKNLSIVFSEWGKSRDAFKAPENAPRFVFDDGTDETVAALPHCPAVTSKGRKTGTTCDACGLCARLGDGERVAVYKH